MIIMIEMEIFKKKNKKLKWSVNIKIQKKTKKMIKIKAK